VRAVLGVAKRSERLLTEPEILEAVQAATAGKGSETVG
jgi:hypothetical protein